MKPNEAVLKVKQPRFFCKQTQNNHKNTKQILLFVKLFYTFVKIKNKLLTIKILRMKTIFFLTIFVLCSFLSFSQITASEQPRSIRVEATNLGGTTELNQLLISRPNVTANWNNVWQSGFFDSHNAANAPEPGTWFWGINMGHRYNRSDYSYGGQIAIRFGSVNPAMFFRSSDTGNGWGGWSRVLTNTGTQQINGDIHLPILRNIRIGAVGDTGNRLRLHHNNVNAFIDYSPDLIFRGGNNLVRALHLTSDGRVIIGEIEALGSAFIRGAVDAEVLRLTSDERLKSEIKPLTDDKISRLFLLQGKSYKKMSRSIEFEAMTDTLRKFSTRQEFTEREVQRRVRTLEFGFLAQELKEVFPELVVQSFDGYYAVNYIGLIPIIVEALKEQRNELREQREILAQQRELIEHLINPGVGIPVRIHSAPLTDELPAFDAFSNIGRTAVLHQNVPNPFNQSTQIQFYLPETVRNASLIIFDMQGKQLIQIPLTQRGDGVEVIQGSQLSPGIYLYALIADGREVDVKRMILTQ